MKQYTVVVECVVHKRVICEGGTRKEIKDNPWDYAVHETEVEQMDWEVLSVTEEE